MLWFDLGIRYVDMEITIPDLECIIYMQFVIAAISCSNYIYIYGNQFRCMGQEM